MELEGVLHNTAALLSMQGVEHHIDLAKWLTGYRMKVSDYETMAFNHVNHVLAHLVNFVRTYPDFFRRLQWDMHDMSGLLLRTAHEFRGAKLHVDLSAHLNDPSRLRAYVMEVGEAMGLFN